MSLSELGAPVVSVLIIGQLRKKTLTTVWMFDFLHLKVETSFSSFSATI